MSPLYAANTRPNFLATSLLPPCHLLATSLLALLSYCSHDAACRKPENSCEAARDVMPDCALFRCHDFAGGG